MAAAKLTLQLINASSCVWHPLEFIAVRIQRDAISPVRKYLKVMLFELQLRVFSLSLRARISKSYSRLLLYINWQPN